MAISIGRLREDTQYDYKFVCLSHNTLRGAAGGAVLLAELLCCRRLHGLILFGGITMKKPIFTGAGVAIITPFTSDGKVNYPALKRNS